MRILHTSDWHLGQKFLSNDRLEEHQLALDWLIEVIKAEKPDLLIVAGDIFDVYNPPNYARELYYSFLKNLIGTGCKHVLVTAGNHDSPSMLGASKEVLKLLDIQVVVGVSEEVEDNIFELKDENGKLEAVIAAVPFLRDEDIRKSIAGQSDLERSEQVKKAIYDHFQSLEKGVKSYSKKQVPILTTGHLYARGAEASAKQDNIYIGNIENIDATEFPAIFDYVALGHIHRAQKVGGLDQVRYCGSLIPLSFSETKDEKIVLLIDFEGKKLKEIQELPIPIFRRLKTIEGTLEEVKERLLIFADKERPMRPWVEVVVNTEQFIPNLHSDIQDFVAEMELDILKVAIKRQQKSLHEQTEVPDLMNIDHFEVFEKKCESLGRTPEDLDDLKKTYRELSENFEDILENGR